MKREIPGVRPYRNPAGGWGALRAVARTVREQMDVADASRTLLHTNQPDGFDCPGCAWPDKTPTSTFQFCENGAKAVTWEATRKRVTPDFFAQHTVSSLLKWSDFELEGEGRITHPMSYDPLTDTYQPIEWVRGVPADRRNPSIAAGPQHGGVLHLRAHVERSGVSLPAVRARVRHQQFSGLFEHVPRGDERGPAEVHRDRQGHGVAR